MEKITNMLFELQDIDYKYFTSRSIPNIDSNNIIGVRIPDIRKLADKIKNKDYIEEFNNELAISSKMIEKYIEEKV